MMLKTVHLSVVIALFLSVCVAGEQHRIESRDQDRATITLAEYKNRPSLKRLEQARQAAHAPWIHSETIIHTFAGPVHSRRPE